MEDLCGREGAMFDGIRRSYNNLGNGREAVQSPRTRHTSLLRMGIPLVVRVHQGKYHGGGAIDPFHRSVNSSAIREVSLRAAQEGATQRTVILRALKAIGFVVKDDELCDKRKQR